jgi:hypothetical protein
MTFLIIVSGQLGFCKNLFYLFLMKSWGVELNVSINLPPVFCIKKTTTQETQIILCIKNCYIFTWASFFF